MVKLNRRVEYALIALRHMSQKKPGEITTAKEINELYGCPFDATSRSLQVMTQRGVLKSEQGPQGGYLIIKDLNRIDFLELTEMILGPVKFAKCLQEVCQLENRCNIKGPVQKLNSKLIEFYKTISVNELISSGITETDANRRIAN